ncbi:MAG: hypothetical protein FJZ56_00890 [Chlamydiae bacterium]|nr:hypothetical protein [Chlamydiota bacterium]
MSVSQIQTEITPSQNTFWSKTSESVAQLSSKPISTSIGIGLGIGLIASSISFAHTFSEPELTTRLHQKKEESSVLANRVATGFALTGSVARFSGWVHKEIFWQAGGVHATSVFSGIGFGVGIVTAGFKAFGALEELSEIDRLKKIGEKIEETPPSQFFNAQVIEVLNYISHILFAGFCVMGIVSLIVANAVFPLISFAFLFGSFLMGLSAVFMKIGNGEEQKALNILKSHDLEKQYTYYTY